MDTGSIISVILSGIAVSGGIVFWFTQFGQLKQRVDQNAADIVEAFSEIKELEGSYKTLNQEREAMSKELMQLNFVTTQLREVTESLNKSIKEMISLINTQNNRITDEIVRHAACKYYAPNAGQK
jgi:predicted  nucleic acid-binding Zn-ribbon protein